MFNTFHSFGKEILGIGIDDKTAICIEPDGTATVYGSAAVSIFQKDDQSSYTGNESEYAIDNLRCDQLIHGWRYNLVSKTIIEIPNSAQEYNSIQNEFEIFTNTWFSGTDNIYQNLSNGIPEFLNNVDTKFLVILCNENYESSLTPLTSYLTSNSYNHSIISLSSASINDPQNSQLVDAASAFIIAGDDLLQLSMLSDNNNLIGNAFKAKIFAQSPCYFIGNSAKLISDFYVDNVDSNPLTAYYGQMTVEAGIGLSSNIIIQPKIFEDDDYAENRTAALLWGLANNLNQIGIYINGNDFASINKQSGVITAHGDMPLMLIDSRLSSYSENSSYIISGSRTRQVVGINNLRYTISNTDKRYNMEIGTDLIEVNQIPDEYYLGDNYPNPFNGSTIIPISLNKDSNIKITVYDTLGRRVIKLFEGIMQPGTHNIRFDTHKLGIKLNSGIYYYTVQINREVNSGKMVYLK